MEGFNFFCFLRKYLIIWSNYCHNSPLSLMGWLAATTKYCKISRKKHPLSTSHTCINPLVCFLRFWPGSYIVRWPVHQSSSIQHLLALSEYWQRGKESVGGRVIRGLSNIVKSWTDTWKEWDVVYREMVVVAERLDSPLMPSMGDRNW